MATISDGEMRLECRVATEAQLQEGLAAARVSLNAAGVDFEQAFEASTLPEVYGAVDQLDQVTEVEWAQINAWRDAEAAARAAMQVGEKHGVSLLTVAAHERTAKDFTETLTLNPRAKLFPEPDAGPHYAIALAA